MSCAFVIIITLFRDWKWNVLKNIVVIYYFTALIRKKRLPRLIDSSQKLIPSLLHQLKCEYWFWRFKSDFYLKDKKKRSGQPKKFEDAELQALLDENSARTLEKLAETLNVGKSIVSYCLHTVEKIKKKSKWVPHDLSKLAIQNCLTICTLLLSRHKKSSFCLKL